MRNDDYRFMRYVGEHYFDNRFATTKEIKSTLKEFDLDSSIKHKENSGGTPLVSDGKKAWVDDSDQHTLIIGTTGSMKTRAFIVPTMISLALAGENMVISDPKGELFENTSGFMKKHGYKINVLNFRDINKSNCWNPLHEAYKCYKEGNIDDAKMMLSDITTVLMKEQVEHSNDKYWPLAARDFIYACLLLQMYFSKEEKEFNFGGLVGFLTRASAEDHSPLHNQFKRIIDIIPDFCLLKSYLNQSVCNATSTRRGVFGHVTTAVSPFLRSKQILNITSNNDIDLHEYADPNKKIITYIIVPDEKTSFHCLCSMFVKQLYEILIREASEFDNNLLKRRVNFILDEFANIPAIPQMSTMISAARSRNIRFFLVLQSNAQLIDKYGNHEASTIKTNCHTWCFLNSREINLIKEVVDYIGSSDNGDKPLISVNELTLLEKNWPYVQAVVMMMRSRPYLSTLADMSLYNCCFNGKEPIYPCINIESKTKELISFDFEERLFAPFIEDQQKFINDLLVRDGNEFIDFSKIKANKVNDLDFSDGDDDFDFTLFTQRQAEERARKAEEAKKEEEKELENEQLTDEELERIYTELVQKINEECEEEERKERERRGGKDGDDGDDGDDGE